MRFKELIDKHELLIIELGRNMFLIMILLMVLDWTELLHVNRFLNIKLLFLIGIFFGAISIFLWNKTSNKQVKVILKWILIAMLILFVLTNINFDSTNKFLVMISNLRYYFFILVVALTFLNFTHNDVLKLNIHNERENELISMIKRQLLIKNTKKIPIISTIIKYIYIHGVIYIILLVLIIATFVAIRYPYLEISFTGVHNLKYSTFVEPARNMLKEGPWMYKLQYTSTPFFDGVYSKFPNYPLMEWGLYGMYSFFPNNTIEYNTRIFTTLLGVLILLFVYLTLIKFLSKKQSLIILALLSTTYIFQLLSFVTVMDVFIILFLFISLFLFLEAIDKNNLKLLFISGIIAGIGVNTKYSAILFYVPIFLIFLFLYKNMNQEKRIVYLFLFLPNLIIQTIIFKLSLANLPSKPIFSMVMFIFFTIVHIFIYLNINKLKIILEKFIKFVGYRKVYFIIMLVSFTTSFIILNIGWVKKLAKQFLTNKDFLFDWTQYTLFFDKIQKFLTDPLYVIALMCMITMLFLPSKRIKLELYAFLSGSIIYLVLASKAIYPHEYYNHIIIFTFILFVSCLYLFIYIFETKLVQYVLILLLILLFIFSIYPLSKDVTTFYLSREKPIIKEVSVYLNEHMTDNEIILLGDDVDEAVALYADRKSFIEYYSFGEDSSITPKFKTEIASGDNLSTIMKRYFVKYYISKSKEESTTSPGLTYLFFNEDQPWICARNITCTKNQRLKEVGPAIFKEYIKPNMVFEKEISGYYIYRFYD